MKINIDAQMCLKKLEYVGVLNFATVGLDGSPQVRCISAIHYEPDALHFLRRKERLSVRNCWQTDAYRSWRILDIRR